MAPFSSRLISPRYSRSRIFPAFSSKLSPSPCRGVPSEDVPFRYFLTDYAVVDRIIDHLKLTFFAERPPPPHIAYQEILMAAEAGGEYSS